MKVAALGVLLLLSVYVVLSLVPTAEAVIVRVLARPTKRVSPTIRPSQLTTRKITKSSAGNKAKNGMYTLSLLILYIYRPANCD